MRQTKEERELRELLAQFGVNATTKRYRIGKITAMRKAVIEECAKVIEGGFDLSGTDVQGNKLLREAAAAIRGR